MKIRFFHILTVMAFLSGGAVSAHTDAPHENKSAEESPAAPTENRKTHHAADDGDENRRHDSGRIDKATTPAASQSPEKESVRGATDVKTDAGHGHANGHDQNNEFRPLGLSKHDWLRVSGPMIWGAMALAIITRFIKIKGKARQLLSLHKFFAYSAFAVGTVHGVIGLFL